MNISRSTINVTIFISLILSVLLSLIYVNQYDYYQLDQSTHIMLKEETLLHWFNAALIIEQIKNGTSLFLAGGELFTKPLPQRLVALYAYILDFNIVDDWELFKVSLGKKLPFLVIQSFVYYSSVFIFFKQISKHFDSSISSFVIFFLCLEPTLFQYHSSFWTESFYFSMQLLILSLMLSENRGNLKFIFIGILLSFLFLQRSAGIFYIFIIIIYYTFTLEKEKLKKITLIIIPYIFICIILGIHNYKRAGVFYVMPTEGKYGMYKYFAKDVLKISKKISINEINNMEVKRSTLWIKDNMPEINYKNYIEINSPYEIGLSIKNEKDKIKFYNYLNKRAYEILIDNPIITLKKVFSGFVHFSVLNPFFVFYDYEYYKDYASTIIGDFVYSESHKKLIPIRIIYSLIIFFICFLGLIECIKKNLKLTLLLLSSVLYYYLILGWYGKTRLFLPCLIYISVFFGFGVDFIRKKKLNFFFIKAVKKD